MVCYAAIGTAPRDDGMKHAPFDMKRRQRQRRLTIALGLALLTGIILSARVTGTESQPARSPGPAFPLGLTPAAASG